MDSNIPSYFLPRSSRQTGSQVYWFRVKVWYLTTPLPHFIFVCICVCVCAMMKEQMKPIVLLYYFLPCFSCNLWCISLDIRKKNNVVYCSLFLGWPNRNKSQIEFFSKFMQSIVCSPMCLTPFILYTHQTTELLTTKLVSSIVIWEALISKLTNDVLRS